MPPQPPESAPDQDPEQSEEGEHAETGCKRERSDLELVASKRERARIHARNTRQRKKEYLESLEQARERLEAHRMLRSKKQLSEETLEVGTSTHPTSVLACARGSVWGGSRVLVRAFRFFDCGPLIRPARLQAMCKQKMGKFLELWFQSGHSREEWAQVVTEDVDMHMPTTPYRYVPPGQVQGDIQEIRILRGIHDLMVDSASIEIMGEFCTRGNSQRRVPVRQVANTDSSQRMFRSHRFLCLGHSFSLLVSAECGGRECLGGRRASHPSKGSQASDCGIDHCLCGTRED